MSKDEKIYLTKEALDDFKKEYRELMQVRRPEAVERVAETRVPGEMEENTDHIQAKQDLAFIDGRISELEEVISKAVLLSIEHTKHESVNLGCEVTVKTSKDEKIFQVVGEWEADPIKRKISHESPLGQALIGKKVGDIVEVKAPAGTIVYTITKIA